MFNQELNFFVDNQERLVQQYGGKVLTIKGEEVVGVFNNTVEAYLQLKKENKLGEVMIQSCVPGKDAYTVSIASVGVVA